MKPRHDFVCEDSNGGPPTAEGSVNFIRVTPAVDTNTIYFEGPVALFDEVILNQDEALDQLADDIAISIFSAEGGLLLQKTTFSFTCEQQQMFLFDQFGANSIIAWIELDGREVSMAQNEKMSLFPSGPIVATANNNPVRIKEMSVISSFADEPINYTPVVGGRVLEPGYPLDAPGLCIDDYKDTLKRRLSHSFLAVIIAESLDGTVECNAAKVLQCDLGFNLNPTLPEPTRYV